MAFTYHMLAYIKASVTGNAGMPATFTISRFIQSLNENGGILPQNIHDCFISQFNSFFTSHSIIRCYFLR